MKRAFLIISLSLCFFILELASLLVFHYQLFEYITLSVEAGKLPRKAEGWRWGLSATANIKNSDSDGDNYRLFILGGSTAIKFFAQNNLLYHIPGVSLYDLTTPRQSILERLMLVEHIKRQEKPGLILLTIHPISLSYDNPSSIVKTRYFQGEHYRYGIESITVDDFYHKYHKAFDPPIKWRLALSANSILFLAKQMLLQYTVINRSIFHNLFIGDIEQTESEKQVTENLRTQINIRNLAHLQRDYSEQNIAIGLELLDSLAKKCDERNLHLAIFELPYDDNYRKEASVAIHDFHYRIKDFLASHPNVGFYSIPYSAYRDQENIFTDTIHLTEKGSSLLTHPFNELLFNHILPDAKIKIDLSN